jgi:hypothetical protein
VIDERTSEERPVPVAWRQTFVDITAAFAAGDYGLRAGISGVEPLTAEIAQQIQQYIAGYGATLVALPNETWDSSVCIWSGDDWDTLVDLWTQEEGRSDLVLQARVTETPEFSVSIHLVYVP